MAELAAAVRSYATAVLDRVEPVDATDVLAGMTAPPRPRRWRTVLVASVAVAVVGAIAVTTATLGRSSPRRIATGGLPTTWRRLDSLDAPFITAMASSAHGVVAVGEGIWYSRDARAWRQVLDASSLSGPGGGHNPLSQLGQLRDVIRGGPGFVAVGQAEDPLTRLAVAAVWTSTDGRRWVRASSAALTPPTPPIPSGVETPMRGYIQSVSTGGPGLVAVGGVFGGTFVGGTLVTQAYDPAVWTSRDGRHWVRAATGSTFGSRTSPSPLLTLSAVVGHGHQVVVAATSHQTTSIFVSADGSRWRRTATVAGAIGQMTDDRGLLVAVGNEGTVGTTQRGVIWTSTDATQWRQAAASAPAPVADYTGVASAGGSIVVVGYQGAGEPVEDGVLLVSADARTWLPVPVGGAPFAPRTSLTAATTLGGRYLVFGNETASGDGSYANPYRYRLGLYESTTG